jgi:hypothetical protein
MYGANHTTIVTRPYYHRDFAMKSASLKLPEALFRKLQRAAKERGQTQSQVMRSALEQYLNGKGTAIQGSFLEAAAEYIGCFEGPGDLSTNEKYMEGFGE